MTGPIGYPVPMPALKCIASLLVLSASAAYAAESEAPPLQGEYRLSAEQIEQVLRDAETKPAPMTETIVPPRLPVRGQVGVGIGTDRYRSISGAIEVGDPQTQGRGWIEMDWRQLYSRTPRTPAQ